VAGLVPAIHVFHFSGAKTWTPGTTPGMTENNIRSPLSRERADMALQSYCLMNQRIVPKPFDFILDVQFFSLEFGNLKVVGGGMGERFVDFLFQRLVPFFEFRKMRFNRHVACLLASDLSLI
jgi:hypothetical protein